MKNRITVPNSVFYLGLAGVVSYVFGQAFGAYYSFNTLLQTLSGWDFPFNFDGAPLSSLTSQPDPSVRAFMEAFVKAGIVIGLVISAIYISVFLAFLIRGRKHALNKPVFVVYLVFSSMGLLGQLVSLPALFFQSMESSFYIPFYYAGESLGFVASCLIFTSCLIFIIRHSRATPPQPVMYVQGYYGQGYPPSPYTYAPYPPPAGAAVPQQPESPPAGKANPSSAPPCASCGRPMEADASFCPNCGTLRS